MATRSLDRIRAHYEIEQVLAAKLASASKAERSSLYTQVYNELFSSVPDHPQLTEKDSPTDSRKRMLGQAKFVQPLLKSGDTYLEVGPGTCELARHMAETAGQVYAVDVSEVVVEGDPFPDNMTFVHSDGTSVPVPKGSVDLAFSNQLMEHLHPDDAVEQLAEIYRALKANGTYFCITPSRLSGPHDVSAHFQDEATGLHLKEYSYRDVVTLFREAGFQRFSIIIGYRGWGVRCPLWLGLATEAVVGVLPKRLRRFVGRIPPIRLALGIKLIARK